MTLKDFWKAAAVAAWIFLPHLLQADTLVVLNKSDATASLVDLQKGVEVATVPTGTGPHEVAVSSDGTLAVVSNYGTREEPGSTLTVIEVPSAKSLRTIDLSPHKRPHGIMWLPGTPEVVVTSEESKALLLVDVDTGKISKVIPTDQEISHMVAVDPQGKRAYVASIGSGSVTILDIAGGSKIASIPTGDGAEGIAISPDGSQVWITNRAADTVSVLDTGSQKIAATLESRSFPIRARFTPDGRSALISNAKSGEVAVFDVAARKEVRRIAIPLQGEASEGRLMKDFGNSSVPIGVLIHPDGKRAYVALANADAIVILDLAEGKVAGTLKAGTEPDGLGYSRQQVKAP